MSIVGIISAAVGVAAVVIAAVLVIARIRSQRRFDNAIEGTQRSQEKFDVLLNTLSEVITEIAHKTENPARFPVRDRPIFISHSVSHADYECIRHLYGSSEPTGTLFGTPWAHDYYLVPESIYWVNIDQHEDDDWIGAPYRGLGNTRAAISEGAADRRYGLPKATAQ